MYVEDVAAITGRLTLGSWAGVLNLASGRSYTFLDVIDGVSRAYARAAQVVSRPRTKPHVNHGFSNQALTELFPGLAFTSLAEGIRRMAAASLPRSESNARNGV
jgi:hypothetical protein